MGYASPEAALGGPLAAVQDGDAIAIDIPNRKMSLLVGDGEIAERLRHFRWEFPKDAYPRFLRLFVKNVGPMSKGGVWED